MTGITELAFRAATVHMTLVLLLAVCVQGQVHRWPKFLKEPEASPFLAQLDALNLHEAPDAIPFLEAQRDALNLHEVPEDAALSAPIAIDCTARGSNFKTVLLQKGAVALRCNSGCEDADETSGKWEVYGVGPFLMDSCVCKAALVAGVIKSEGGEVTVTIAELEPEFVPYATLRRFTFCFEGMTKCKFDHDPTGSRAPPVPCCLAPCCHRIAAAHELR